VNGSSSVASATRCARADAPLSGIFEPTLLQSPRWKRPGPLIEGASAPGRHAERRLSASFSLSSLLSS
jgi:hypothetical protein